MKKILLTVALFTVLGTMAVSCQKDLATNQATVVQESIHVMQQNHNSQFQLSLNN